MRALAAIRSSGALWFVPVLFALGTVMPILNDVVRSGYAVSDVSSAGIALGYLSPLLAGFAAFWFHGRARFHRTLRSTRSGLGTLLAGGWPVLVGGPVAGCAAVLVTARTVPTDVVAWQLLAVYLAVLTASALIGVAATWAMPVVLAVPSATALCFWWINYLPASDRPLLHHLSPTIDGFSPSNRPAVSGIVAVLIVSAVVMVGVVACVGRRSWDRTPRLVAVPAALATPVVAASLGVAYLLTSPTTLSLMVTEPRTTSLTCSTQQGVDVCLWPEGLDRAGEVADVVTSLNRSLQVWGLPQIREVGQGGLRPGAVEVAASPRTSRTGLHLSLAAGYLEQQKGCEVDAGRAFYERVALLSLASGVPVADVADEVSPEALETAGAALRDTPPGRLGRWYVDGLSDVRCTPS